MNCWIAGCPGWRRTACLAGRGAASGRRFAAQLADRAGLGGAAARDQRAIGAAVRNRGDAGADGPENA